MQVFHHISKLRLGVDFLCGFPHELLMSLRYRSQQPMKCIQKSRYCIISHSHTVRYSHCNIVILILCTVTIVIVIQSQSYSQSYGHIQSYCHIVVVDEDQCMGSNKSNSYNSHNLSFLFDEAFNEYYKYSIQRWSNKHEQIKVKLFQYLL